ncbi:oxidoreductase [Obelidium mucronatum]|nr:oxidoreductase [Obelidium mucronatum]
MDEELWTHFTPHELAAAAKVLEALGRHPQLKQLGRAQPDLQRVLAATAAQSARRRLRAADEAALAATGIRVRRRGGNSSRSLAEDLLPKGRELEFLNKRQVCHICKAPYRVLHHFYDRLCVDCGNYNYAKRSDLADMTGRIGYCIVLQLLRANAAKVIVTTRFPNDAAARLANEPDASSFVNRVVIYGIDFRSIPMLQAFCSHIKRTESRLDVLINNAAQTVRKPPAFYRHLIDVESLAKPIAGIPAMGAVKSANGFSFMQTDLIQQSAIENLSNTMRLLTSSDDDNQSDPADGPSGTNLTVASNSDTKETAQLEQLPLQPLASLMNESSALSQIPLIPTDMLTPAQEAEYFPEGFGPWILISELKPLMVQTGPTEGVVLDYGRKWDKYIVNVSAMEGQFNRAKTTNHPHTNMAKASLNMLTRTSAAGFVKDGIYMTCVDTGWVTIEHPLRQGETELSREQPPLDEMDGAMRVLDPVFVGVRGEDKFSGIFFKDYAPTDW